MTTLLQGPVEVTPSRRRASTTSSTGLDHSNCPRIDEDISSRIRSLLLSRNVNYPPRTPFSSDEHLNLLGEDYNGVGVSDFGTAKSAATSALHEARRMSLPSPEAGVFSQSIIPSMDGGVTRRPTQATLRSSSSTHDMTTASKDPIPQNAEDRPHPQAGSKKKFRFPRLVLQDKKKRDTSIKSCVEISPKIPEDDAKIHVTDLFCCPPCNPMDTKPSKYIVGFNEWPYRALQAEPGDLACFLAGCPPGRTNCKRHNPQHGLRRSHSISLLGRERNMGQDFKAIAQGLAQDVAKLGLNIKDVKIPSTITLGPLIISDKQPKDKSRPERRPNNHDIPNSRKLDGARSGSQQDSRNTSFRPVPSLKEPSPRSSITSIDAFPHVVHSEEVAAKEAEPLLLSSTVVTNFSLPGPKARRSNAGRAFSRQHSTNQFPLIEDVIGETDIESSQSEAPQTMSESQLSNAYNALRKQSVVQFRIEPGSRDPQSLDQLPSGRTGKMGLGRVQTTAFSPKTLDEGEEDLDESGRKGIAVQTDIDVEEGDASEEEEDKGAMSTGELKASGQQGITVQVELDMEEENARDDEEVVSKEPAGSTLSDQDPVEAEPKSESGEADEKEHTEAAAIIDEAIGDESSTVPVQEQTSLLETKRAGKPSIAEGSTSTDLSMLDALPSPVVGHLTNLKNAIDFVDNVKGRMQDVEKKYEKRAKLQGKQTTASNDLSKHQNDTAVPPDSLETTSNPVRQPITASPPRPGSPQTATRPLGRVDAGMNVDKPRAKHPLLAASSRTSAKPVSKAIAEQDAVDTALTRSSPSKPASALLNTARPPANCPSPLLDVDPLDSTYWGFVPAVKEAVQDAVQVAVRNAVHEMVVPPGVEQDTASDAYRKLVANSLSQAAQNADDYLRRASLWNQPPSSPPRLSEAGVQSPRLWSNDRPRNGSQNKSESGLSNHQENSNRPKKSNANTGRNGNADNTAATSSPQSPSTIGLETVPLDEQRDPNDQNRESRLSASWKKGAPAGYSAIPARKSSRNHVLGPRSSSTNSSQRVSPKNPRSRGRSYERLASRSQGLRSISSVGSLENPDTCPKAQKEDELGRNNTVHWLKELLSNDKPYESRLTALPPRIRRGENRSIGRIRSQTAPIKPVDELFLGATPQPVEDLEIPKFGVDKVGPETFTKTINDLENLLNEALFIARQAADREDAAKVPIILEDATKMLKDQKKILSEESLLNRAAEDRNRSRAYNRRGSDEVSSVPSIHESLRSYSGSSASEFSDNDEIIRDNHLDSEHGNRGRNVTISSKETGSNHPSGWPPTGRSSTPYPPQSQPPSGNSITVDTPLMDENISDDSVENIRVADPRSMPAETGFPPPRKSSAASKPYTPGPLIQRVSTSFTTLEPFRNPASSGVKRESSAKSPGRVSPAKKSPETRDSTALQDTPYNGRVPLPRANSTAICKRGHSEDEHVAIKARMSEKSVPSKREVREHIKTFRNPPIQPRASSLALRKQAENSQGNSRGYQVVPGTTFDWQDIDHDRIEPCSQLESEAPASARVPQGPKPSHGQLTGTSYSHSLDGTLTNSEEIDFSTGFVAREHGNGKSGGGQGQGQAQAPVELKDKPDPNLPPTSTSRRRKNNHHDLRGKSHVSLREHKGFSLARSHKRQTIARDWSPGRKRFSAAVACISTALVGILAGIYAGEVPAIQYYIVDFHHYTVLGNVFFFIALSVPTFFFWPLPLLHGRKPYILGAMATAMPLLFPQAIAVGQFRSPYVSTWRVGLILSRALMGFCLGFANMNFKSTLTDLFGASLQSENPHQEVVDEFDVRRHGGGMGVWLGLWTWSAMGSIGVGFMAGAVIINSMTPAWGFYISIIIIAAVLLLNIVTPEVRRSAYRRSVAEVRNGPDVSRRLARGEVKMHLVQTGPKWWGEEFHYGVMLSLKMIRQPGFLVMSLYVAWMYAQIVLIIVLLGSLTSKYYKFKSPQVGLSVTSVPLGAMLAIPFQSASLFSRSRSHGETTDDETFDKKVHWSSHLVRRAIFILVLPFAGLGYTLTSTGPPIPFILPILFAALIGFLSNLAMAECHGIIMETFDTSDLQPGMTGRPRGRSGDKTASKRTNYSSFPRVASAFAITQGLGYLFAAVSTGVGGSAERQLGAQAATAIMAGILLILSILLLLVLARFKEVQIIPDSKADEMSRWRNARRASAARREEGAENEEEPWRPVIIGNPTHHTRRMCLLEMGGLTRWSEIRRKNRLVDEQSLEAKHPNLVALEDARERLKEAEERFRHNVRRSLSRASSRGSRGSRRSDYETRQPEGGDLGGHREMLSPSGNGSRRRKSIIRE